MFRYIVLSILLSLISQCITVPTSKVEMLETQISDLQKEVKVLTDSVMGLEKMVKINCRKILKVKAYLSLIE